MSYRSAIAILTRFGCPPMPHQRKGKWRLIVMQVAYRLKYGV